MAMLLLWLLTLAMELLIQHRPAFWLSNGSQSFKYQDHKDVDKQNEEAQNIVFQAELRHLATAICRIFKLKRELRAEVVLGNGQTAAEAVLMEAVVCPCTDVADASLVLYVP